MSGVINHKSRALNEVFNFPASDGNLSGQFTPLEDCEIFHNPLTTPGLSANVASLTIGGVTPTYPFLLTGGTPYSIVITKQVTGAAASVSLTSRIASDRTRTYNIVDYGSYTGAYKYVLFADNTVAKMDESLLVASNYAGSGGWTVSPYIKTITLPALPGGILFTLPMFVKVNGVERILLIGSSSTRPCLSYACYIRISDDTVWDLSMSTPNGFTQITNINSGYGTPLNGTYNYIDELVYFKTQNGSNGTTVIELNLLSNTIINKGYSSIIDGLMSSTIRKNTSFIAADKRFAIASTECDFKTSRSYYYLGVNHAAVSYNRLLNVVLKQASSVNLHNISAYNRDGSVYALYNSGGLNVAGFPDESVYSSKYNLLFKIAGANYGGNNYVLSKFTTGKGGTITDIATSQTYMNNPVISDLTGNCFAKGATGQGVSRMYCFQYDQTPAYFGYYDFGKEIKNMCVTQLIDQ